MPAYIIAMANIKDAQKYGEYAKRAGPANAQHGSKFVDLAMVTREGRLVSR